MSLTKDKLHAEVSDSSSDSLKNYAPTLLPQGNHEGDSSPLPAGTPFGGRKSKLSDMSTLQRNLRAANEHFSLDTVGEIRDFQPPEDGPEEQSMMQPRLKTTLSTPAELRPVKMNSNPFKQVQSPIEEGENVEDSPLEQKSSFLRRGKKGLTVATGTGAALQRAISKQDYDVTVETLNMKQSTMGLIEEKHSQEERGEQFANLRLSLNSNAFQNNYKHVPDLQDRNEDLGFQRSVSLVSKPDSPTETIKNGQLKEMLRKHFQKETEPMSLTYSSLDGTQLQIEGPYHMQDLSYSLVNSCKEIKRLEQGIPFDPYLLLNCPKSDFDNVLIQQSFSDFEARLKKRRAKMEHSILNRVNCHKEKFDQLYKSFNLQFADKNRYPDMLPFTWNRVQLNKQFRPFESLRSSSFSNSQRPQLTDLVDQLPVFQVHSQRPASQSIPVTAAQQRVPQISSEDSQFEDYINASWIDSCLKKQLLIAASAPKQNTASDFLHMIMEQNVKLIMKVCDDKVGNAEQCFRYTGKMPKTGEQRETDAYFGTLNQMEKSEDVVEDEDILQQEKQSSSGSMSQVTFTTPTQDGEIKYVVDVLKQKRKFQGGLIVRKVRVVRKVYRRRQRGAQEFFGRDSREMLQHFKGPSPSVSDNHKDEKQFFAKEAQQLAGKTPQPVSTSKAELTQLLLESEDTHYFTQVMDVAWEDHKPPTSRGDQRVNYLRMAYMTRKMIKQSRKRNLKSKDPSIFVPDQRILVHCSAGRGRTGTLITTFLIAEHLLSISETLFPGANSTEQGFKDQRQEPDDFYLDFPQPSTVIDSRRHNWCRISLFSMVRRLREQRWCMVSTDAQYAYCYQFLAQWVKEGETARLRSDLDRRYGVPLCMPF